MYYGFSPKIYCSDIIGQLLVESCKMNGIDFGNYIEYVMERMVAGKTDARSLLPTHIQFLADWVPEGQLDDCGQQKIL